LMDAYEFQELAPSSPQRGIEDSGACRMRGTGRISFSVI